MKDFQKAKINQNIHILLTSKGLKVKSKLTYKFMIRKFTEYEKLRKEYYDTNKKPNEVKKVVKPWGYELWMADKSNSKFALKKIFIKAPHQSSIQFHETKEESIFIASGKGRLHYSDDKIDIENLKKIYIQKKKSIALLRV